MSKNLKKWDQQIRLNDALLKRLNSLDANQGEYERQFGEVCRERDKFRDERDVYVAQGTRLLEERNKAVALAEKAVQALPVLKAGMNAATWERDEALARVREQTGMVTGLVEAARRLIALRDALGFSHKTRDATWRQLSECLDEFKDIVPERESA